jgi:AcrR family transcriptional regulator|nr:TetR/AcrR family transcriptional regulator [Aquabacterium fontiphilum]
MTVSRTRVNPESPASSGTPGRRYGGVDSEERQRQRRAKLIDAGLAVFGEQGYHASTVRDVCARAQLTSRYFYESFDSMEALFKAVYVTINRELMQHTVMALARCEPQPEKLAEAALRTFFEFIRDDPRRARVGLIDAMNVGQSMSDLTGKATQDFAHLIAGFMRQMFPNLEAHGLDHQIIADGLVGSNTRIATQWVADRCKTPLEDVLRNAQAIFEACIAHARAKDESLSASQKPGKTGT